MDTRMIVGPLAFGAVADVAVPGWPWLAIIAGALALAVGRR